MGTIKIKRKQIQYVIEGLSLVVGMKDYRKGISLGLDSRVLKDAQSDIETALNNCKPDNYDVLLEEFQELQRKKASEYNVNEGEIINENGIISHILLSWDKAKEWSKVNTEYNKEIDRLRNEVIDIDVHTELTIEDFPKCAVDVRIAEALTYFLISTSD